MEYATNVGVLNDFFGLGLKSWSKGEYCLKINPNRLIWFPKMDYIRQGKKVTGHPDWSNTFFDDSKEIIITKPLHPNKHIEKNKMDPFYWDSNVEIALFARTKNPNGAWEGKYMGIYCFLNGDRPTGERRYKRIEKEINKDSAANWLRRE